MMSVRREAANRVTINCWYTRDGAVQLVLTHHRVRQGCWEADVMSAWDGSKTAFDRQ